MEPETAGDDTRQVTSQITHCVHISLVSKRPWDTIIAVTQARQCGLIATTMLRHLRSRAIRGGLLRRRAF